MKKYITLILFTMITILSIFLISKVNVNYDMTKYLDDSSLTKEALDEMNEDFKASGSFYIMVTNVQDENEAYEILKKIQNVEGISMVMFDYNDKAYHNEDKILFSIFLEHNDFTQDAKGTLLKTKEVLKDYQIYTSGGTVDSQFLSESVKNNMVVIMIVALFVVMVILVINSVSWIEPVIFFIVVGVAIIINMGTNAFLPSVSFVTQSICAVMQLALAMDYSIVVLHTFTDYMSIKDITKEEAMKKTLKATFMPILGSSLTTVAGLLALTFIHFKMGSDIGITLSKGIVISLLTVLLLMPQVILLFTNLIVKFKHRSIWEIIYLKKPNFETKISSFQIKTKVIVPVILTILICFGYVFYLKTEYAFTLKSSNDETSIINIEKKKIEDEFGIKNAGAILIPKNNYEIEKEIVEYLKTKEYINTIQSLSTNRLYDEFTKEEIVKEYGFSLELVNGLYKAIGKDKVKLIDLLYYIKDNDYINKYGENYQKQINDLYEKSKILNEQVTKEALYKLLLEYGVNLDNRSIEFLIEDISKKLNKTSMTYEDMITYLYIEDYLMNIRKSYQDYLKAIQELETKYTKKELATKFNCTIEYINSLHDFSSVNEIYLSDFLNYADHSKLENCTYYEKIISLQALKFTKETIINSSYGYFKLYPKEIFTLVFKNESELDYTQIISKLASNNILWSYLKVIDDKCESLYSQVQMLNKDYTIDDVATLFSMDKKYFIDLFMNNEIISGKDLLEKVTSENLVVQISSSINDEFIKTVDKVNYALSMFEGSTYERIAFNLSIDTSDIEASYKIDEIRKEVKELGLIDQFYVFGASSAYRDFENTFSKDSLIINIVSFVFIFVILVFSFKSLVIPILLTIVIEGAIWVTMAINYFSRSKVYFICYLLVVCIQMGSTIDYGIIFTNNYVKARKSNNKAESLKLAFCESMPTIMTSGLILIIAAWLVGLFSEVSIISEIGFLLSKGSLISVLFILLCLPQILVLFDRIIQKGTLKCKFLEEEYGKK